MASSSNAIVKSSSSSSDVIRTYDVFVSFRGKDTRNNFTAFLFRDLSRNGIKAFKDDTHLHKGQSIAPELLQAIQASRIFIVVFSKNYASSTWCLRELVHICNCIQTSQRRVLPIFYDVDPSEVRRQSGCYETAFLEHEERFMENKEKMKEVQIWREALTKVANLAGWDIQNKPQYVEIEEIIRKIKNILGHKLSRLPKDNLVGIESRVNYLLEILCLDSVDDVRVVGISGMGGIGKTTLAHSLYERISDQYDFCCFVDVSNIYRDSSTIGVQKQILSQCLNEKNLEISNASEGTCLVWTRLRYARALVVLDNIDKLEQLNMFTGNRETLLRDCLGGGSRVIIISRDKQILKKHGVDYVYEVQPLSPKEAVQLFYKYAFKGNDIMSHYEMLTNVVLSHVQGHPLAIQVLGSSLFDLNISQWRSALVRLKEKKSDNVMDVLQLSYDQLDDVDKKIFLDIACLLNHSKKDYVVEVLHFRGFHPEFGLQLLIDKSLITIEDGLIKMHTLLRDLGRRIVQKQSPNKPRKWSRLWAFKDFNKVMSDKMGFENLEAITVTWKFDNPIIRVDALSKMSKLKFLKLENMNFYHGSLDHLCNELGYLIWENYHLKSLPPSFQPNNLIELSLKHSNIKQLWKDKKPLPNLKRLNLCHSQNLTKVPNLGEAINLQSLNLAGCEKLRELHPSIGHLTKLTLLDLGFCKSLINLPDLGETMNLLLLNLAGCEKLRELHPSIGRLTKLTLLDLGFCKSLIKLPDLGEAMNLRSLNLAGCEKLRELHPSIGHLTKLTFLDLGFCKSLLKLPDLGEAMKLRSLNLAGCEQLRELPPSIGRLTKLTLLDLKFCKSLVRLPNLREAMKLRSLNLAGCEKLRELHPSIGHLTKLTLLDLGFCKSLIKLPDLREVMKLQSLNLARCEKLKKLHPSIGRLTKLTLLNLEFCKSLIKLPHFRVRKLTFLNLYGCENLVSLPNSILYLDSLEYLNLSRCSKLLNTRLLHEPRDKEDMNKLRASDGPICSHSASSIMKRWFISPLHLLNPEAHKNSARFLLPSSPVLPCIRELNLRFCNLVHIPDAIRNLHFLEIINLEGNKFSTLPCLKKLSKLYILNLEDCRQLKYLSELPSQTHLSSERLRIQSPIELWVIGENRDEAGLNIYGCTELVEMERCSSMAFAWTIQLLQAHYRYKCLFSECIKSIIPGSEIPSWFTNQHEGIDDIITIDKPPLMQQGNNCIGLICCLVLAPLSRRRTVFRKIPSKRTPLQLVTTINDCRRRPTKDHLWMLYSTRPLRELRRRDADSKLEIRIISLMWPSEVKKYGYRWVYEKNQEVSNLSNL